MVVLLKLMGDVQLKVHVLLQMYKLLALKMSTGKIVIGIKLLILVEINNVKII
jgi:hypothetical protein